VSQNPLRVTFYESGIGETILIDFPNEKVGVIDAYPPGRSGRSDILDIIGDREVEFVCLTHPHEDHGKDLVKIIEALNVKEFWHSLSPVNLFVYQLEQHITFPSHLQHVSTSISQAWAEFMLELLSSVARKGITERSINESHKPIDIGSVRIHFLAPSENFINLEHQRLGNALSQSSCQPFDPNDFSLVIAIEYGSSVVVLGSDAKRKSWRVAVESFAKAKIPKAAGLKIPHHGALNAFDLKSAHQDPSPVNCWRLCRERFHAVLFAGTIMHPHQRVLEALREREVQLHSLFHLDESNGDPNPLGIRLTGSRVVRRTPRRPRYSSLAFEIFQDEDLSVTSTKAIESRPPHR
jgi:beta-lactamase superfamily II metal-dependent hydrolase